MTIDDSCEHAGRQTAQQRPFTVVVAYLPGGDEQVNRAAITVADGVQFGDHAAKLVAMLCAFR